MYACVEKFLKNGYCELLMTTYLEVVVQSNSLFLTLALQSGNFAVLSVALDFAAGTSAQPALAMFAEDLDSVAETFAKFAVLVAVFDFVPTALLFFAEVLQSSAGDQIVSLTALVSSAAALVTAQVCICLAFAPVPPIL